MATCGQLHPAFRKSHRKMNGAGFVASRRAAATDAENLFSALIEHSAANEARLRQAGLAAGRPVRGAAAGSTASPRPLSAGPSAFAPRRHPGNAPHPVHRKAPVRPAWDASAPTALEGVWRPLPTEAEYAAAVTRSKQQPYRRKPPPSTVAFGSGVTQPAVRQSGFMAALASVDGSIQQQQQQQQFYNPEPERQRRAAPRRPASAGSVRTGAPSRGGAAARRAAPSLPTGVFGNAAPCNNSTVPIYHDAQGPCGVSMAWAESEAGQYMEYDGGALRGASGRRAGGGSASGSPIRPRSAALGLGAGAYEVTAGSAPGLTYGSGDDEMVVPPTFVMQGAPKMAQPRFARRGVSAAGEARLRLSLIHI